MERKGLPIKPDWDNVVFSLLEQFCFIWYILTMWLFSPLRQNLSRVESRESGSSENLASDMGALPWVAYNPTLLCPLQEHLLPPSQVGRCRWPTDRKQDSQCPLSLAQPQAKGAVEHLFHRIHLRQGWLHKATFTGFGI